MTDFEVSKEAREALAIVLTDHGTVEFLPAMLQRVAAQNAERLVRMVIAAGWVPAVEYRDHRITDLEATLARVRGSEEQAIRQGDTWLNERDAALAVIEKARKSWTHDVECASGEDDGGCDCWQSILAPVDTSALVERDAEKWDEGMRIVAGPLGYADLYAKQNPYRALAEGGEKSGE